MPKKREYPWDPAGGELDVDNAYEAFCVYRDLPTGERTVDEVSRLMGLREEVNTLRGYARKFNWKVRANQYAAYKDKLRRKAAERALETRSSSRTLSLLIGHYLTEAALSKARELAQNPSEIQARDLRNIAEFGLAKIQPLDNKESSLDLSKLTDEELTVWQQLLEKAGVDGD